MSKRIFLFFCCALLMLTGIARAAGPIKVVTTFSILDDMVKNVGGDRVAVTTLVGPDGDVHVYSPTPADARAVNQADLVIVNGLGLEGWMNRLIKASGYRKTVVVASRGVKPRTMSSNRHHNQTIIDPHAWQDLNNGMIYVANITQGLIAADPADAAYFQACSKAYMARLVRLNTWVKKEFATVPKPDRRLITSHDAFGYLGDAYGVQILSPMGINTESEPSAGEIKTLIQQIRTKGISAIFIENITDPRMLQQIASESGVTIGGVLYSDALSKPHGPASTYIKMFRYNISQIVTAMKKGRH